MNKQILLAIILGLLITGSYAQDSQSDSIEEFKRRVFKFSNKPPGIYDLNVGFDDNQ